MVGKITRYKKKKRFTFEINCIAVAKDAIVYIYVSCVCGMIYEPYSVGTYC